MAKFKVGDKVNDRAFGGPLYIVGLDYVNGSLHGYFVSNRPNGPRTMEKMEKDLVAANAKFNVGDKVEDRNGNRGKVYEIKPSGGVIVYFDDGTHDAFKPELLKKVSNAERTICTTNAVVANALRHESACNAKFNVGDKVTVYFPDSKERSTGIVEGKGRQPGTTIIKTDKFGNLDVRDSLITKNSDATSCNANVRPEIQKEYDAYVKAKAKFDKWWNPDRRLSEGGKDASELQEAEKAVWKKWLAVFGKPIPSGWASNPSVLANADPTSCNATFKKGDRIKLKGGSRTGTVIGESTDKYHAGQYDIQWDSYPKGMLCPVKPENLVANATACNANTIKIVQRGGYWWCMMPDGNLSGMSKTKDDAAKWAEQKGFKDWVVVNNAQSCNAGFSSSQWGKFKKGDKVRCKFCHEDEIGLLQGVSCYGLRTDFSDTAFRVDFPTQKGVTCLGCELVKA